MRKQESESSSVGGGAKVEVGKVIERVGEDVDDANLTVRYGPHVTIQDYFRERTNAGPRDDQMAMVSVPVDALWERRRRGRESAGSKSAR